MRAISVDESIQIQLDILDTIIRFCENENIHYSLAYGSLLGAIRHKGFIPWDDDLDIMMPRSDYEKFIEHYNHSDYKVIVHTKRNNYQYPFAKVHLPSTTLIDPRGTKEAHGVFVDIFPVDEAALTPEEREKFQKEKQRINKIHTIKLYRLSRTRSLVKNIVIAIAKMLVCIKSIDYYTEKMEEMSIRYKGSNSPVSGVLCTDDNKLRWLTDTSVFQNYAEAVFEGRHVKIVKNWDSYLKLLYGDYMKLPPESQRVLKHNYTMYYND